MTLFRCPVLDIWWDRFSKSWRFEQLSWSITRSSINFCHELLTGVLKSPLNGPKWITCPTDFFVQGTPWPDLEGGMGMGVVHKLRWQSKRKWFYQMSTLKISLWSKYVNEGRWRGREYSANVVWRGGVSERTFVQKNFWMKFVPNEIDPIWSQCQGGKSYDSDFFFCLFVQVIAAIAARPC